MDKVEEWRFEKARQNLTEWSVKHAARLKRDLGFDYEERDDAPQTYKEVRIAYNHSLITKDAFPVWSGESDNTMFLSREANWANRYWHDLLHAALEVPFTLEGEVKIGKMQTEAVKQVFGEASLEAQMMYADSVGQSQYADAYGHFPTDQLQFVKDAIGGQ